MIDLKKELTQKENVQVVPGGHFVTTDDIVLSTLLGSCVAACLYDPVNRVVGMNHFLLASKRYPREMPLLLAEAGRYGVHAMEILINAMLEKGAQKKHMKAKAFGGGNILKSLYGKSNFSGVGELNARFIHEFLKNEQIPLVAADLGGDRGRVIYFFSEDFRVQVRKIQKTMSTNLAHKEQYFWKRTIKKHESTPPDIQIWNQKNRG